MKSSSGSYSKSCLAVSAAVVALVVSGSKIFAAEDLKLRPGISFTQDIDAGFPIVATDIDNASIDPNLPTLIFFGAACDLNTNRQAKRLVDIYHKIPKGQVKFIVIDVDHPANEDAKKLIRTYYSPPGKTGYIPFEVILDKSGKAVWSQIGEVEISVIKGQLDKVI
ncbi:MAG: hypothetical protein JST44_18000 [Cyanobacteria bacterium SZAS LIN-5]|nr:hypothetical protein [Cyanobacteria bacterium SZAS LIN-5]RTL44750.1 MAG: hypothetical protein EKK48_05745 [Candidatus Melainabacteria bacterium]